jgi:hypothetical protein
MRTWIKKLKLARRNGQDSSGKAASRNGCEGIKVVSKIHANRQDKGNLGSGVKRIKKSCQVSHASE